MLCREYISINIYKNRKLIKSFRIFSFQCSLRSAVNLLDGVRASHAAVSASSFTSRREIWKRSQMKTGPFTFVKLIANSILSFFLSYTSLRWYATTTVSHMLDFKTTELHNLRSDFTILCVCASPSKHFYFLALLRIAILLNLKKKRKSFHSVKGRGTPGKLTQNAQAFL